MSASSKPEEDGTANRRKGGEVAIAGAGDRLRVTLHLTGLLTFAIAQPLLDVLGLNASFLLSQRVTAGELLAMTAAVVVLPPLLAWIGLGAATRVSERAGARAALGAIAFASALAVLPPGVRVLAPATIAGAVGLLVAAAGAGIATALLYRRFTAVRDLAGFLALGALAFPLLFLSSTSAGLLFRSPPPGLAPAAAAPETPVVVVVFDALPLTSLLDANGAIDAGRLPHIAALAGRSDFYMDHTTVDERANYAIPAILTGQYPTRIAVPLARVYPQNLFTLLGERYALNAFETVTSLCPPERCQRLAEPERGAASPFRALARVYAALVVPRPLAGSLPDVRHDGLRFARRRVLLQRDVRARRYEAGWMLDRFLERVDPAAPGTLHFIHLGTPHAPWMSLPSGKLYAATERDLAPDAHVDEAWADPGERIARDAQRHLLQVGAVDTLIGRLSARLQGTGLFDAALVVITADHGEDFRIDGGDPDDDGMAANRLRVPLIIKRPHQGAGRVIETPTRSIDVLPTLAEALGVAIPEPIDGRASGDAGRGASVVVYRTVGESRARTERSADSVTLTAGLDAALALRSDADVESGPDALFAIGAHTALHGTKTAELRTGDAVDGVHIAQRHAFDAVHRDTGFLPARVRGRLAGPAARGDAPLAISLNGVIRATTRGWRDAAGQRHFDVVVPESAFRDGANAVTVHVIHPGGADGDEAARVQLSPIVEIRAPTYALHEDPTWGVTRIERSDGARFTRSESGPVGVATTERGRLLGWAADVERARPAERIVVFAQGVYVDAVALDVERTDVATRFEEPGLLRSGFSLAIPFGHVHAVEHPSLRVFALSGDAARELLYQQPYPYRPVFAPGRR